MCFLLKQSIQNIYLSVLYSFSTVSPLFFFLFLWWLYIIFKTTMLHMTLILHNDL